MPTLRPLRASDTARVEVTKDFPTPPLPLAIPMTLVIFEPDESGSFAGAEEAAPLAVGFLGLNGFSFKTHGNSDALAFANAIKYAADLTHANLNDLIAQRASDIAGVRAALQPVD